MGGDGGDVGTMVHGGGVIWYLRGFLLVWSERMVWLMVMVCLMWLMVIMWLVGFFGVGEYGRVFVVSILEFPL